jgi:LmbE family N-acetylglucosaminyl deacetylase
VQAQTIRPSRLNIIIVAHPDDESLFFGGLILSRKDEKTWVVCVTDAGADGNGSQRKIDFEKACSQLNVERSFWLGFEDTYEKRLDITSLKNKLNSEIFEKAKNEHSGEIEVFTHSPVGEYMHPHHQDVSYAVHSLKLDRVKIWGPSYNCFPDFRVELTPEQFSTKSRILADTYGSETIRFINMLPATHIEGFKEFPRTEVEKIYKFLSSESDALDLDPSSAYYWLKDFLLKKRSSIQKRMF